MPAAPHTLTLLARQTRMINASEGQRLEVHSGCLWLTRPGDAVDRFLVAGASIELFENQVLIQSDWHPANSGPYAAHYRLTPLSVPASPVHARVAYSIRLRMALRYLVELSSDSISWARRQAVVRSGI